MINRIVLAGRLGADPEIKSIGNDQRVARLSVATNESWHTADGEPKEKTFWHVVSVFKKQSVEFADRNFKKGDLVAIEGQLEYRDYEKDGQKHRAAEIAVRTGRGDVTLLAKRPEGQPQRKDRTGPSSG